MAAALQLSILPDTVEKCHDFIRELKTELTDLLAQHHELQQAAALTHGQLTQARMDVARLEISRNSLLMTIEAQMRHVEVTSLERARLMQALHGWRLQAEASKSRLNELERGAKYVDRMLATATSPEEHLGAVYGFGSQIMVFFHLPAPPSPRELLFGVMDAAPHTVGKPRYASLLQSLLAEEEDGGSDVDDATSVAGVSSDQGHECDAHARACYHEAKYGIVASMAETVLHMNESAKSDDD
jgi:hypothetical protein